MFVHSGIMIIIQKYLHTYFSSNKPSTTQPKQKTKYYQQLIKMDWKQKQN